MDKIPTFSNLQTNSPPYHIWILFQISVLTLFPASPTLARERFEKYLKKEQSLKRSATFHLKRKFKYPADTELVELLLRNLDISGTSMKVWKLGNFEVNRKSSKIFKASKGDDLDGKCYRIRSTDTQVTYLGTGTYRPDEAPVDVQGTALIDIKWNTISDTRQSMTATLRLRPNSWILHWLGKLVYVLVKPELTESFDELIERGKKLAINLKEKPRSTFRKLKRQDLKLARKWKNFAIRNGYW